MLFQEHTRLCVLSSLQSAVLPAVRATAPRCVGYGLRAYKIPGTRNISSAWYFPHAFVSHNQLIGPMRQLKVLVVLPGPQPRSPHFCLLLTALKICLLTPKPQLERNKAVLSQRTLGLSMITAQA